MANTIKLKQTKFAACHKKNPDFDILYFDSQGK